MSDSQTRVVGLISDTHGLLRPGVHEALTGVELILHSGDVGGSGILDELRLIAPVQAVFGNTAHVVVFGHTHRPLVSRLGNQLFVNPGSAGPKRFDLSPSVARLTIKSGKAEVKIVDIP